MTMQSDQGRSAGFLHSATGQMTLLGLAVVAVLIVGWLFIW